MSRDWDISEPASSLTASVLCFACMCASVCVCYVYDTGARHSYIRHGCHLHVVVCSGDRRLRTISFVFFLLYIPRDFSFPLSTDCLAALSHAVMRGLAQPQQVVMAVCGKQQLFTPDDAGVPLWRLYLAHLAALEYLLQHYATWLYMTMGACGQHGSH